MENRVQPSSQTLLSEAKIHFHEIVASLPVSIFVIDASEDVVYANPAAKSLFGDDFAFSKGDRCGDFISCKNRAKDPAGCGYASECADCRLSNAIRSSFSENENHVATGTAELHRDSAPHQLWVRYHVKKIAIKDQMFVVLTVDNITESKIKDAQLLESNERFQAAFMGNPNAVVITRREDGVVVDVNPAVLDMFGYTRGEMIGKSALDLDLWVDKGDRAKLIKEADRKGEVKNREILLRRRDGSTMIASLSMRPLTLNGVKNLLFITEDITQDKTAEKALLESERKWRNILIDTPQIGVSLDPRAAIVFANKSLLDLTGWQEKEVIGCNWFDLFVPEDIREEVRGVFDTVMHTSATGGFTTYENEILTRSGEKLNVAWSNVLTKDPSGQIVDVTCLGIDLTERKRSEKALQRRLEFERLISEISSEFVQLDTVAVDAGIENALASIGVFTGADRAYIFQYRDNDTARVDNTHEWCAEGIGAQIENLQDIPLAEELPWFAEKILNHEVFQVPDVSLLPPEAQLEREHFEAQHIQSIIVIPMVSGGRELGFLGLDAVRTGRVWSEDDQSLLKIIGETITHALNRRIAEQNLRESEEKFRSFTEHSFVGFYVNQDGLFKYVNPKFAEIFAYAVDECTNGMHFRQLVHPEDLAVVEEQVRRRSAGEIDSAQYKFRGIKKTGEIVHAEIYGSSLVYQGKPAVIGTILDVTKELEMEKRLAQSQRMEAIGSLAGGIAHDFNNILFPIVGLSELLLEDLPADGPQYENAREILKAGQRGSDLVKQILTFSRQSEQRKMPIRIQQILKEVMKLIRATIPVNIQITQDIQPDCPLVLADPTQIHQIAMNLITNAYHAVGQTKAGISVRLRETELVPHAFPESDLPPGRYALLSVADTGSGIDPLIIDKIFEPYFTTKEEGKGTGLGLAVVYGIVKEHQGDIRLHSDLGKGTKFDVYLPIMAETEETVSIEKREDLARGTERILLVDDEEPIIRLEKQILERLGYHVTERTSSYDALREFAAQPSSFDLLISDMTMPNMTGDQLAREFMAVRPDFPVIICTGFSERLNRENAAAAGIRGFLMKPIVKSEMARMVRKVLDEAYGAIEEMS